MWHLVYPEVSSKYRRYVILSQAPGLDLFEHVKKFGYFTETTVKPIVIQILSIINSIHSKKIIHMDIKPENICWGNSPIYNNINPTIKIIDFGFVIPEIDRKRSHIGTYSYADPTYFP